MTSQKLIFTQQATEAIDTVVNELNPKKIFVLVDSNAAYFVLPTLQTGCDSVRSATVINIPAGDVNKGLDSAQIVWKALTDAEASRHDLLINVGGGMVTDLGGFAAATYKRGIRFINVPTTLLGAVDAAVGGKTGINFGGYKNQVGVFCNAQAVIISTTFFSTLTKVELLSGYAEMIKHAMLTGEKAFADILAYDISDAPGDNEDLLTLLKDSVTVKQNIVAADPTEKGLRKALNFGHTIGHAFESFAMQQGAPIPHGFAVAYGMVVETILSHIHQGFPSAQLHTLAKYVTNHYNAMHITCEDYPELLRLMQQDKKNDTSSQINFTLLHGLGDPAINCTIDNKSICDAMDIYRDMAGI